jgi:Protein of unknown function (DUF1572)
MQQTYNAYTSILLADLLRLKNEITAYSQEKNLWLTGKGISNSAGNLCLHLIGNLNTYIGAHLRNTGYLRNRELEFSLKDIPRQELLQKIDATMQVVELALNNLTPEQLQQDFPLVIWDQPMTTEYTLIRLTAHLSYHLGQISYHRRLLDQ